MASSRMDNCTPRASRSGHARRTARHLFALVLPCLLAIGSAAAQSSSPRPFSASYVTERDRLRSEIERGNQQTGRLAAMEALRQLAENNGDADTARLMEVERIFATHDDADIDTSLRALNAVRSQVSPEASPELHEALARVYGNLYFDVGHFGLALEHQLDALAWADKLPKGRQKAKLYRLGTIAELYNAMELPNEALRHADKGLSMLNGNPELSGNRVSLLGARAAALRQLGRLSDADHTLVTAERLVAEDKSGFNAMRIVANRATLALAMAQPEKAAQAIAHLQELAKRQQSSYYLTRAKLLHGQARIVAGDVASGLREMREATAIFERDGQMIDVLDGLGREIHALRAQRAWPEAVASLEHRQSLWSRLFRSERTRALAELEAQQRAIAQEQRIATLAAQVDLERTQVRAERLRMALFALLALLAAGISGLLLLSRQRARRERDRLSHAVRHDPLTGAFSRYEFQNSASASATKNSDGKAVLLLDLDNFKAINDVHGHSAGDAVLKTVVSRLRKAMRAGDIIYRWGGEEFLLILEQRGDDELADTISALRHAVTSAAVTWDDRSLTVTLSGGLVRHPLTTGWSTSITDTIRWADAAMYAAKHAGRDRILQVQLTNLGVEALVGHRPIDMAQLLDWQRQALVLLTLIGTPASAAD